MCKYKVYLERTCEKDWNQEVEEKEGETGFILMRVLTDCETLGREGNEKPRVRPKSSSKGKKAYRWVEAIHTFMLPPVGALRKEACLESRLMERNCQNVIAIRLTRDKPCLLFSITCCDPFYPRPQ